MDFIEFKTKNNYTTFLMNRARYYKTFVQDNGGDQRKLFQGTMELLKPLAITTFPLHDDTHALANDFGRYFVKKMLGITPSVQITFP